jgi:hypothetical protein
VGESVYLLSVFIDENAEFFFFLVDKNKDLLKEKCLA